MKYFKLLFCFFVVFSSSVLHSAAIDQDTALIANILKTQLDAIIKIPGTGMSLIESGNKSFYVSDNGRLVIVGKAYDMWSATELKTVADIDKFANTIDIFKLGINFDDIGALTYGYGKQEVALFFDPNCSVCYKMLGTIIKLNKYLIRVILLPILGNESLEKVKKGICSNNKTLVSKTLLNNTWDSLPTPSVECNLLPLQKISVMVKVLGINQVPFLIRNDGRVLKGYGNDNELSDWLSNNSDDSNGKKDKVDVKPQQKK